MLINGQKWQDCDMCGEKKLAEYGFIAQGATGRWCVVLSACSDCVDPHSAVTPATARAMADTTGYADF